MSEAITVEVPNKLPPIVMPNYTNEQIEQYLKNMEEADGAVHKLWNEFNERWENSSDEPERDMEFVVWLTEKASVLVNLREILLLQSLASFEDYTAACAATPSKDDDTDVTDVTDKFVDDFKAVSFVNKVIYCIARAHNIKEEAESKRYKETLKKQLEDKPADNVNFE